MVTRKIRLADHRGRDATVLLLPMSHSTARRCQDMETRLVKATRRIKVTTISHPDVLLKQYPDPDALARVLIDGDPEVDLELTGRIAGSCDRVYLGAGGEVIYTPSVVEVRYGSDGTETERRPRAMRPANTVSVTPPVWSGVLIPVSDAVKRYAFTRAYQVPHSNALEFDFLMGIASYLHERETMVQVGSGRHGRGPLILERNGPKYRGFLSGKVMGDSMRLILHLSGFELKPQEEPA
jgi:hypothetical protein